MQRLTATTTGTFGSILKFHTEAIVQAGRQVCAILTSLGMQPPDLQAWARAEATGHARELHPPRS